MQTSKSLEGLSLVTQKAVERAFELPDSLPYPNAEKVSTKQRRGPVLPTAHQEAQEASGFLFWSDILECPSVIHCHLLSTGEADIYIFKSFYFVSKLTLAFSGAGS